MYRIKRKRPGAYSYVQYVLNGETHRLDGPAIEFNDGGKYWYIHGKEYTYFDWMNNRWRGEQGIQKET